MNFNFKTLVLSSLLFFPISAFGAVTDDGNMTSITWSASPAMQSYNVDTGVYQSGSNSPWGAFSPATWAGFFGSFSHIRMFETATNNSCSAFSITSCAGIASDSKDYWVSGSIWSVTDPSGGGGSSSSTDPNLEPTSCGLFSTSTTCHNEITYYDWLLVNLFILFFLSLSTLGFYMSRQIPK